MWVSSGIDEVPAVDPRTGSWPTLIRWTRIATPLMVVGLVALMATVVAAHPRSVTTGSARVRSCTAVAKLAPDPSYSATAHAYVVGSVSVRAGRGCAGMAYQLTMSAGSRTLAQATGQLDTGGAAVAKLLPANVAASQVTNIGLTLTNGPTPPVGSAA